MSPSSERSVGAIFLILSSSFVMGYPAVSQCSTTAEAVDVEEELHSRNKSDKVVILVLVTLPLFLLKGEIDRLLPPFLSSEAAVVVTEWWRSNSAVFLFLIPLKSASPPLLLMLIGDRNTAPSKQPSRRASTEASVTPMMIDPALEAEEEVVEGFLRRACSASSFRSESSLAMKGRKSVKRCMGSRRDPRASTTSEHCRRW